MPIPTKVLIVEDEMIIAARISMHLENMGYEVVGIMPRGEEAIQYCQQTPPDILLLDIRLKGKLDGIETAKLIQQSHDIPIIYLTANTDQPHFDRAKETLPFAFLSKPYQQQELQRTIELVLSRLSAQEIWSIRKHPGRSDNYLLSDRIFVRNKTTMVKVLLKEVCYITAERSYCRIHTVDEAFLLSMPLGTLDEKLHSDQFMRIHRSYIVNLNQLDTLSENHVTIGSKVIPIGSAYREEFLGRMPLI